MDPLQGRGRDGVQVHPLRARRARPRPLRHLLQCVIARHASLPSSSSWSIRLTHGLFLFLCLTARFAQLRLYVKKVLISDEFQELLPRYMNFIKVRAKPHRQQQQP